MELSRLIKRLQETLEKHGELDCQAFQHPEDDDSGSPQAIYSLRVEGGILVIS